MAAVNLGASAYIRFNTSASRHCVKLTTGKLVVFANLTSNNNKDFGYKTSSDNGANWDANWTVAFAFSDSSKSITNYSIYHDSSTNNIYITWRSGWDGKIYFRKGTYDSGSWSWGSEIVVMNSGAAATICRRANGDLWIVGHNFLGTLYSSYSTNDGTDWNANADKSASEIRDELSILAVGSDIWTFGGRYGAIIKLYKWTTAWDSGTTVASNVGTASAYYVESAQGIGKISDSEIYLAAKTTSGIKVYKWNGSSWDSGTLISDNSSDESPSISIIENKPVVFFRRYDGSKYQVSYSKWNGSSWDNYVDLTSGSNTQNTPDCFESDSNYLHAIWMQGTSSAFTVYYEKVTIISPTKQKVIDSDTHIKVLDNQETIDSNSKIIIGRFKETIESDALIHQRKQETIESDTHIKVLDNQKTINSDAIITTIKEKTIKSDAIIKVIDIQETISSDTKIIYQEQEIIQSDSKIVNQYDKTIDSNAHIKTLDNQKNINSDANIVVYHEDIINTDIRTRAEAEKVANLFIATQFGGKVNCDLRIRKETEGKLGTDLRFTPYDPELVSLYPLARTDFHVFIDDVETTDNDLKLDSVRIVHTADNKSTAEFILLRKHDNLDTPTEITNYNVVKIYLKDKLEFTGRISNLDTSSEDEYVRVHCETDNITEDYNIVTKELPLTILNNQLHLYDILINDVAIENPYMSSYLVIIGSNNLFWNGVKWVRKVYDALTFETFALATAYIAANQSNAGFTKNSPVVTNYEQNPRYYKGIAVDLGKKTVQNIIRYDLSHAWVTDLEEGTFKYLPNYSYFWTVALKLFPSGVVIYNKYIGTSLAPISGDLYEIVNAHYQHQRILDDIVTELGYYTIGEAPFKFVSIKNGQKIRYGKWADREDGRYLEYDEAYDYENYDKQVAALEYDKIKNINGDILPATNANLDLTIDGYLYYKLKLLTRININNTTTIDIYKDNNEFPVSIKQITIDSNTMKVNLVCDNQKSAYELDLIDGQYPEEPEEQPAYAIKYANKYDLPTQSDVDD